MAAVASTTQLYHLAPAQRTCLATVTRTDEHAKGIFVCLNQTIFCPQIEGRHSDIGTINGIDVLKVRRLPSGEITHYLDVSESPFSPGDEVEIQVNDEVRLTNARQFTAGRLIQAVVEKEFGLPLLRHEASQENGGIILFNPSEDPSQKPDALAIEELLKSTLPVIVQGGGAVTLCNAEQGNMMCMDGYDSFPCEGTFVSTFADIGGIEILGVIHKKKKLMIRFEMHDLDPGTLSINALPPELLHTCFSLLDAPDLANCRAVSTRWCEVASNPVLWKQYSWGAAFWNDKGHPTKDIPFPSAVYHPLVLMPKDLTIDLLGELFIIDYQYYDAVKTVIGNLPVEASYWFEMSDRVVEGSRHQPYETQTALVTNLPTALEAVTFMLVTRTPHFGTEPNYTYTRTADVTKDGFHVVVGGMSADFMFIYNVADTHQGKIFGVASCTRYFGDEA